MSIKISDVAREERRNKILIMLKEEPMTVKEIQAVIGGSYHTSYREIQYFLQTGQIVACGKKPSGEAFTANTSAKWGWPLVFDNAGMTSGRSLKAELNAVRRDNYITNGVKAAFRLSQLSAKVIEHANDVRTGQFDKPTVDNLRMETAKQLQALESFLVAARNIYHNDECWTRMGLERISKIEDFPARASIELMEKFELPLITEEFLNMIKTIENKRKEQADEAQRNSKESSQPGTPNVEGTV